MAVFQEAIKAKKERGDFGQGRDDPDLGPEWRERLLEWKEDPENNEDELEGFRQLKRAEALLPSRINYLAMAASRCSSSQPASSHS